MSYLRRLTDRGRPPATAPAAPSGCRGRGPRSTTSWPSSAAWASPATSWWCGTSSTFCRRLDIHCQGRGSAANSAVCYALGVTNVDAVALGLLFERFLSAGPRRAARHRRGHRVGPAGGGHPVRLRALRPAPRRPGGQRDHLPAPLGHPGRRQGPGLHARAGGRLGLDRRPARPRQATRAAGPDRLDRPVDRRRPPGADDDRRPATTRPAGSRRWWPAGRRGARPPRHLGIHSAGHGHLRPAGGRGLPGRVGHMPGRTVLQWDKDDCAAIGLVKFDLLGLGMLEALHRTVDLVAGHHTGGRRPGPLPQDPGSTTCSAGPTRWGLPGREPGPDGHAAPGAAPCFYDLVVEVALIRPGPIQGQAVNPYIRRRHGRGAGHLPAPPARADPPADPRGPPVPRAADGDGGGHRRLQRRRGRRAAPGHGGQALGRPHGGAAGPALRGHGRAGDHRGGGRRRATGPWPPSPTSASPNPTRSPSPISSTRRPGSSTTTRRPSSPGCSTPSPWGSGRPRAWWPTPAGTGSRSAGRTSTGTTQGCYTLPSTNDINCTLSLNLRRLLSSIVFLNSWDWMDLAHRPRQCRQHRQLCQTPNRLIPTIPCRLSIDMQNRYERYL